MSSIPPHFIPKMLQLIEKKSLQFNQQRQVTEVTKANFLKAEATQKRLYDLNNTMCCYGDLEAADTFEAYKKYAPGLFDTPEVQGLKPEARKEDWQAILAEEKQAKRDRELAMSPEDRKRYDMQSAQKRIEDSHLTIPDKEAIKGQLLRRILLEEA